MEVGEAVQPCYLTLFRGAYLYYAAADTGGKLTDTASI